MDLLAQAANNSTIVIITYNPITSLSIQAFPESSLRLANLTTGLTSKDPDQQEVLPVLFFLQNRVSHHREEMTGGYSVSFLETTPSLFEEETKQKAFFFSLSLSLSVFSV